MDELRQQPRGLVRRDDVGDLAAQFVEDHPDFATSQVGAQAEMRAPAAEAEMGIGVRATSKSQGLSNVDSSRLAELYHSVTLSPDFILVPDSLKSRVSVRRM